MSRRKTASRQVSQRRARPKRQWFLTTMIIGLVAIVALSATSGWPWYLTWYLVWNLVAFLIFGYDKNRAQRNARRVPELVLHLTAWLGGAAGALAGMLAWRHKTQHLIFWISCWAALVAHAILIWYWW